MTRFLSCKSTFSHPGGNLAELMSVQQLCSYKVFYFVQCIAVLVACPVICPLILNNISWRDISFIKQSLHTLHSPSPVSPFLSGTQTIVQCRMQERVGMGVLVIVLAVDRLPFSCFKLRCTELQLLFAHLLMLYHSQNLTMQKKPDFKEGYIISRGLKSLDAVWSWEQGSYVFFSALQSTCIDGMKS